MAKLPTFELVKALAAGDQEAARACFGKAVNLEGVYLGKISTEVALQWGADLFPTALRIDRSRDVRLRSTTSAEGREVSEVFLPITTHDGRPFDLPFAIMGSLDGDGLLGEARYYFCEKPLTGELRQRLTSFPNPEPVVSVPEDYPDVNAKYIRNQIAWNIPGIVEQFGNDPYLERGADLTIGIGEVEAFYRHLIIPNIPVKVVKNTGTYDGKVFVLEWSSARALAPSGLATYERDEQGQIKAIRMYDNSPWPCD